MDATGTRHYRLFCLLERAAARLGLGGPSTVVDRSVVRGDPSARG
jgi:hypothetical protein